MDYVNRGNIYNRIEKFQEAITDYKRALVIYNSILSHEGQLLIVDIAMIYNNLAVAL